MSSLNPRATTEPAGGLLLQVWLIPVLRDNYVFVLQRGREAVVVDPAVDQPVAAALKARDLQLQAILHTHHHSDHIGGTPGLLQVWPQAQVIAAAADRSRIPLQTKGVGDGDSFQLLGETIKVLAVPGHTRAHLAYWLPGSGHLFCGDTLFAAGCGRLFEGSAEQMHTSLQRLGALPAATQVWCAHEYTEGNLRWASAVAPNDGPIADRLDQVLQQRAAGHSTVPTSIGLEKSTNLFVRASTAAELAALRGHKDGWSG